MCVCMGYYYKVNTPNECKNPTRLGVSVILTDPNM